MHPMATAPGTHTRIGIVDLGYVGLPLAVGFGKQFAAVGDDVTAERIAELRGWRDSTFEVESADLEVATHLRFSDDPRALAECNVYVVTVPTPIDGAYHATVVAVAHQDFRERGVEWGRSLLCPENVIFDVKYLFDADRTDERL